ncbi:MAG: hypothetical protein M3H12_11145 [Chromatiales bacterium]
MLRPPWPGDSGLDLIDGLQTFPPMPEISDITDTERWIIDTTLKERYDRDVPLQLADAEIRLMLSDRELTSCPVVYWNEEECNFVLFKTGDRRYRCQFFYRGYQQYGTGVHEYDDLTECIVSLLQTQADYAAKERGDLK